MSAIARGAVLQLDSVVKHYPGYSGEIVRAVDGVTLTVGAGEVVALHGPSGSGKSTLLMLAAALMEPDAGTVQCEGRTLADFSAADAADYQRRMIGFVFQSFHLMAGVPAVENAAIKLLADGVPLRQARRAALPWLDRVGLAARLDHTPDQLSGGERQRVAIARALVNEPRLILADEPTGSLDTQRGAEILALLAAIAREQQAAVLLVTHDAQAAAVADRVCTLRDGRLVEDERAMVPDALGRRQAWG
ncbi:MAG: transporter related protein [Solirubrobacterales bacterium]|nr:transporter related protein [Solirubrobacterales bacterium]